MCTKSINSCSGWLGEAILVIVLSELVQVGNAQYFSFAQCPKIGGMTNFNISRYEGLWFEVEKYWFVFEATASCTYVNYLVNTNGTFGVEINFLDAVTRTKVSLPGYTWYQSRDGTADFMLELLVTPSPIPFRFKYPYLVLLTDYDNFTIKYRCKQLGPISMQTMWVLSRTKELSEKSREDVYNFLRRVGINVQKLRRSNTSTCIDLHV